jgi:hypothetical protein
MKKIFVFVLVFVLFKNTFSSGLSPDYIKIFPGGQTSIINKSSEKNGCQRAEDNVKNYGDFSKEDQELLAKLKKAYSDNIIGGSDINDFYTGRCTKKKFNDFIKENQINPFINSFNDQEIKNGRENKFYLLFKDVFDLREYLNAGKKIDYFNTSLILKCFAINPYNKSSLDEVDEESKYRLQSFINKHFQGLDIDSLFKGYEDIKQKEKEYIQEKISGPDAECIIAGLENNFARSINQAKFKKEKQKKEKQKKEKEDDINHYIRFLLTI